MKDGLELLDPVSELYVVGSYGDHRNLMVGMAHLSGPLEVEAMKRAVNQALDSVARLKSSVKKVWHSGRFQLAWEERPHVDTWLEVSRIDNQRGGESLFDSVLRHLRQRIDRQSNLFQAAASQFYLVGLPNGDHVLAAVIHHAAASGQIFAQVSGRVLDNYSKIVSGRHTEWTGLGLSTAKERNGGKRDGIKGARLFSLSGFSRPPKQRSGVISVHGADRWRDTNLIRAVLSEEETHEITTARPIEGIHIVDRLVACSYMTLVNWDRGNKAPQESFVISTTVNMRTRFEGTKSPNFWSVLRFAFNHSDGADPQALAHYVGKERNEQLSKGMDFRLYEDVCAKVTAARKVPFALKRFLLRFYHLRSQAVPLLINYLGILWPEMKNGRPTGKSCLVRPGGLEVREVHCFGYKTFSPTQMQFYVYFFRGRLNVVMACPDAYLTAVESKSFMDYFIRSLLASRTWFQASG